jgi:hypothetical protein
MVDGNLVSCAVVSGWKYRWRERETPKNPARCLMQVLRLALSRSRTPGPTCQATRPQDLYACDGIQTTRLSALRSLLPSLVRADPVLSPKVCAHLKWDKAAYLTCYNLVDISSRN